ncbi:hypothetical protein D3C75_889530 [compost metagenome]
MGSTDLFFLIEGSLVLFVVLGNFIFCYFYFWLNQFTDFNLHRHLLLQVIQRHRTLLQRIVQSFFTAELGLQIFKFCLDVGIGHRNVGFFGFLVYESGGDQVLESGFTAGFNQLIVKLCLGNIGSVHRSDSYLAVILLERLYDENDDKCCSQHNRCDHPSPSACGSRRGRRGAAANLIHYRNIGSAVRCIVLLEHFCSFLGSIRFKPRAGYGFLRCSFIHIGSAVLFRCSIVVQMFILIEIFFVHYN